MRCSGARPPVTVLRALRRCVAAVAPAACICLLLPAETPATSPTLVIDPLFVDLGRFSAVGSLDSEISLGKTEIRVLSRQDWRLEVALAEPVCRLEDSLPLATADSRSTVPPVLQEILDLCPSILTSHPGSDEWWKMEIDWREIGAALEQALHPAASPGTYQAMLLARILGREGEPLTGCSQVAIRFDILRWTQLSADIPEIEISTDFATGVLQSEQASLLMTGNSAWRLRAAQAGVLISEDGEREIPQASLTICVPSSGTGGSWKSTGSGFQTLRPQPITIGCGDSPTASAVPWEEIPIVVRLESDGPLPAGRYRTELVFRVSAQEPSP
ncbi:MAG: hypothetical protein KAW17_03870 [Candidatus Eisenbacteria sp.]|nr:hypothetical protein [Candidatus Eisenbacteria bacterium]